MSRPRLLALLVVALSALFVVPAAANPVAETLGLAQPATEAVTKTLNGVVGDTTTAEERRTRQYWTASRRQAASPVVHKLMPLPTVPGTQSNTYGAAQPWNNSIATVGKVFFTLGGQDYVCTATVIDSANRDTVITAGHCLNTGPGDYATNWLFVPGYRDGSEPYGSWTARRLMAPNEWSNSGNLDYDFGYAVLNTNNGGHVADIVGTQDVQFNAPRGEYVHSFGYPALPPYDGARLYDCPGSPIQDSHGGSGQGISCDMTEGSSGGPWFANFDSATSTGTVISVNSFGYDDTPNVMWGPYLGDTARALYDSAHNA